jgi:glycosyltransferase involved in cell wall biosynthesis
MRIVLDARKYYGFGIGTYIQNLIPSIATSCDLAVLVAPEDAEKITLPPSVERKINSSGKYSLSELWSTANDAHTLKADVFHAPHYTTPFGLRIPCVTTIHDILHVRGSKYFPFYKRMYARSILSHACRSSAAILTDSIFTKRELLEVFQVPEDRIRVIYLGVSSLFSEKYSAERIEQFRKRHQLVQPTILYTGSLKPHKNVSVLIEAFAHLKQRSDLQLAFSGESLKKRKHLWNLIEKKNLVNQIVEIGQISHKELALAYQAASVVVLPSLYEGFGFSVLEAMASGIPAIGARAGSIPEVMGESGILFDPYSAGELTEAIEKLLHDSDYRLMMIKKGYENVKRFSWEKCAEQTIQVYKDVL